VEVRQSLVKKTSFKSVVKYDIGGGSNFTIKGKLDSPVRRNI
jgi:hypothetical protein